MSILEQIKAKEQQKKKELEEKLENEQRLKELDISKVSRVDRSPVIAHNGEELKWICSYCSFINSFRTMRHFKGRLCKNCEKRLTVREANNLIYRTKLYPDFTVVYDD